jgi:hypothetical protein
MQLVTSFRSLLIEGSFGTAWTERYQRGGQAGSKAHFWLLPGQDRTSVRQGRGRDLAGNLAGDTRRVRKNRWDKATILGSDGSRTVARNVPTIFSHLPLLLIRIVLARLSGRQSAFQNTLTAVCFGSVGCVLNEPSANRLSFIRLGIGPWSDRGTGPVSLSSTSTQSRIID